MEKSYVKSWIWPIIHKKKGPERQVQLNQVCIIKVQQCHNQTFSPVIGILSI